MSKKDFAAVAVVIVIVLIWISLGVAYFVIPAEKLVLYKIYTERVSIGFGAVVLLIALLAAVFSKGK